MKTYKEKFIAEISELVVKYPSSFFNSVSIAQACLETGFGTSRIYREANNAFGYKAKAGEWDGSTYSIESPEEENGRTVLVRSRFRRYDSVEDSVKDHANMMTRSKVYEEIYQSAIHAGTPEEQARALSGSYATDSRYGQKLIEIISNYDLKRFDEERKDKVAYIGLDIGHGNNSAPRGGNGVGDEHNFNSKVAIRTKQLLEQLGHKVTYGVQQPHSRETSLGARSSKFNALGVDVLISIHANAHSNRSVNGISAFYDRYGWGRDNASRLLAKSIMDEYRKQGQRIWSTGEVPSYRGNWTDFHMNRVTTMPSVLVELGFMTGNLDREYVFGSKQPQFVEDMAQGLAKGVDKYFGGQGQTKSDEIEKSKNGKHIVSHGDTLWAIGQANNVSVEDLREWNNIKEGEWLKTGQELYVVEPKVSAYTVQKGDYLWAIGQKFDVSVDNIKKWNGLKDNFIYTGQELHVTEPEVIDPEPEVTVPEEAEIVGEIETEEAVELEEGQFILDGKIYQVTEVK